MAYMKHATEGNRHVAESEVDALRSQGWVQWPRSLSEKQAQDAGFLPHSTLAEVPARCRDCGAPMTDGRKFCCAACVHGEPPARKKPGPKPKQK